MLYQGTGLMGFLLLTCLHPERSLNAGSHTDIGIF